MTETDYQELGDAFFAEATRSFAFMLWKSEKFKRDDAARISANRSAASRAIWERLDVRLKFRISLSFMAARGERNASAKLTENEVPEIFALRKIGLTHGKIGEKVGCSSTQVGDILRGKSWQHFTSPLISDLNSSPPIIFWNRACGDRHGSRTHPERLARGDEHYSRTHPEKLARGDRNSSRLHPERLPHGEHHWTHTHPERVPRGERSGSRTHPERVPRGDKHYLGKLTKNMSPEIVALRKKGLLHKQIAEKVGCSQSHVGKVLRGQGWKHPNLVQELPQCGDIQHRKREAQPEEISAVFLAKVRAKIGRAYKKAGKADASEDEQSMFCGELISLGVPIEHRSSGRIARVIKGELTLACLLRGVTLR